MLKHPSMLQIDSSKDYSFRADIRQDSLSQDLVWSALAVTLVLAALLV